MKKIISSTLLAILLSAHLACYADVADNIQVSLTQVPLNSKLKREYNGYKYTILNNSDQSLNLVNAQILNAVNGSVASQTVTNGHPIGTTWAICGPIGLLTLGIGWGVGLIATPIVGVVSSSGNRTAQRESVAYPNIVTLGYINKGDSITSNVLVPIGTQPQLKMTFQLEKTKELITVNR